MHAFMQRALASPAFLCIMAMEGIFRGHSDTRAPLLATLVAAITNLVLDPLLMFGPLHLGVAGAAAATAAAQYAAAAVYVVMLYRRRTSMRLLPGRWASASPNSLTRSSSSGGGGGGGGQRRRGRGGARGRTTSAHSARNRDVAAAQPTA